MSPKKRILKTLADHHRTNGNDSLVRPATIPGFNQAPEKYQKTINALLRERMIEGMKDAEGHMAIALNTHKEKDVRRMLRPVWAHPAILVLLALFAVATGATFLL
jgi:hypothetical protein